MAYTSEDQNLQGAPIRWSDGGRRAGGMLRADQIAWRMAVPRQRKGGT